MRFAILRLAAAAGLALAVIAPAQAASAGTVQATRPASEVSAAAFHLPYSDPSADGLLTLCNQDNQPITHGSITAKPFVWRVVSSVPAVSGYDVKNGTATLFAYQPRPYTPPGAWSGLALSAASVYTNPAHPMAQATPIDQPLDYMTESFPPIWDGLYELRLYLGGPDIAAYSNTYPVADLQIKGNTWTLVTGGGGSCTTGSAVSREAILGLAGATGTSAAATHSSSSGSSAGAATPAASAASSPSAAGSTVTASARHSDSAAGLAAVIGFSALAAALVLTTGGLWWRRRRRVAG
jgi:hypothetical protein